MTERWKIQEGDHVTVHLPTTAYSAHIISGYVRSMPQATGDCWVIESMFDTHYIQQFAYVRKQLPTQTPAPSAAVGGEKP